MLISMRSHLIAGTAAVIGAGSVAVAGVQHPLPALPTSASVALASYSNPIEQLLGTLEVGQNYLFGTYYEGFDSPLTPGAGEFNWPFAGMDQAGGDLLNYALYNELALGNYSAVGLLPQLTNQASPIIRQLTTNLYTYINAALSGVTASLAALSAGVWDYPSSAIQALELALNGEIGQAITVLTDAVIDPIVAAGEFLFDAGAFVVTDFLAKTVAVLEVIPQNIALFLGAAFGGAQVLAERSVEIATNWLSALGAGNWEGAWNAAVDGLFGPSGLPGTVLNLTIGAGVQTGPISSESDIAANFVPSFRTATQATIWNTQDALTATVLATAAVPAAAPAAVTEVVEPAAEPAESAAPVVAAPETTGSDSGSSAEPAEPAESAAPVAAAPETAGSDSDSPAKPVKNQRVGKRAAKAAAGD